MTASLAGKRILVVEDEYFIAADIRRALRKLDVEVVGPTGNLARGLTLADEQALDAAVLDINLDAAFSYPIADRLAARDIPCMFLTGYDGWALPEVYRDVPRIAKPSPAGAVIAMLRDLVESRA